MDELGSDRVVWAREQVAITSCPTSYITSGSLTLLEEFHAQKLLGIGQFRELPARLVEAIFLLENELRTERNRAKNEEHI